jgi:hypothetical protein
VSIKILAEKIGALQADPKKQNCNFSKIVVTVLIKFQVLMKIISLNNSA